MTFDALFEHASIGILISDREGCIQKCNPFAARIFGYTKGELLGQQIEVFLPQGLRKKHIQDRESYCEAPYPRAMGSTLDLKAVRKDGEVFPVEVCLSHYETDKGMRFLSFVNDVTERKESRNKLETLTQQFESRVDKRTKELSDTLSELNFTHQKLEHEMVQRKEAEAMIRTSLEKEKELGELKSRFVSMASHEFRTPLGGILTSASLLKKHHDAGNSEKVYRHLHTIKKSVKNLTNILNEFLSLDKLDQGIMETHISSFSLSALVDDIVEGLVDLSEKNLKISIKHRDSQLTLNQDESMLRNVLINLLSNASKYSPNKSTIYFESDLQDENVIIRVKDQGIGIPKEDQKHLFGRFFRAHNVNIVQGTGLGLNIVKRYLDLMGGTINFTSEENRGTTFTVMLPLEKK